MERRNMKYREFMAMSTSILLAAEGDDEAVETGFAQVQDFIAESEKRFTRFSDSSELSQLNRSAGEWFTASTDMLAVISQALTLHHQTSGLFDPGILYALEQAGYDRTIDEIRLHGARPASTMTKARSASFGDIVLDMDKNRIWMPVGLRIDLGGIAKGWIAERAAEILSNWTSACAVNAGGDAYMIGLPAGEKAWQVTLEDPNENGLGLVVLNLQPGAVATSTITKRHWQQVGKTQHHLIDPRTQKPAVTDWLSVTVTAEHATEAEVFAKCLLIGGSADAERITRMIQGFDQPYDGRGVGIEYIAIDTHNQIWGSKHSQELLYI
jgi:FAD:protein FMN transferase